MNESAIAALTRARDYIERGDEFYRKAKIEIDVAIDQDPDLSHQDIASAIGMSKTWVQNVIKWDGVGTLYGNDTERRQLDMAKQVLRESSEKEIHTLVAALPRDAQRKIEKAVAQESSARTEPIKVSSNPLRVEIKIGNEIEAARVRLHEARRLCASVDRPGDDEDIIESLDLLAREVEATKEAYISGESLETELKRILN